MEPTHVEYQLDASIEEDTSESTHVEYELHASIQENTMESILRQLPLTPIRMSSEKKFDSPRRAKRHYNNLMEKYSRLKKIMKSVRKQNCYLKKRIVNLIDLVDHLQKKKLLTEHAGNSLLVS
ncbi:hypothetical protein ABEB36_015807 [Hypothenemus hampei]|uniref:Uncharacterized protein n=1 Tax=Hypothenemus hampei TaxID=57062 RepID=A0ABD1E0K0_HYPHA